MTAEDISWGRGGGRRVPKGVKPGEGLADIEELRSRYGGSFRHQLLVEPEPQQSLFDQPDGEDGP